MLVRTSHPGNIGAAARAMYTMGVTRLVLVDPKRFPDPEATALATGAAVVLDGARVVATLADALAGCALAVGLSARPRAFAGRVLAMRDAAREAIQHTTTGDVALVFGTEMSGLSNAELAQCGIAATIPANPDYASLNVASAVQVAAYEVRVAAGARHVWSAPRFRAATHDEVEAVYAHARRTLTAMRFLDPAHPQAPAAAAAAPVRPRRARARGSEHPARHPRAHRPVRRPGKEEVTVAAAMGDARAACFGGLQLARARIRVAAHAATPTPITSSDTCSALRPAA